MRQPVSEHRYLLRRFVVLAAIGLVLYGAVTVVNTVIGDSDDDAPAADAATAPPAVTSTVAAGPLAAGPQAASATAATAAPAGPSRPTPDDPARVLIVGDSDAGTFGPYLELLLGENDEVDALVDVTLDYVVSSGLSRPDFHDWPDHLRDSLAEVDPDIVIVTFGGNDAQGLSEPCPGGPRTCQPQWVVGDPVPNAAAWTAEYGRRVDEVLDLLLEGDRRVIWVGIPNAESETMTAGLELQDRTVSRAVAEREGVVFVDTWDRFDGRNGGYAAYVQDPRDGRAKPIRASDGFHLNATGAEILALDIFDEVVGQLVDLGAAL